MTARPIRRNAQTPDRNGKIFYTSTTSLSHISKGFRHHTHAEDMEQYEYIKRRDEERARAESRHMFEGPTTGSLFDDPVINYRYLFIASITLACRRLTCPRSSRSRPE